MIKSRFESQIQQVTVKLGLIASKIGLSPNTWTLMALVPAVLGFSALLWGSLDWGLIMFILAGLIDAVDGAVARVTGATSARGAFLDGVVDRYTEFLLYLGLYMYLITYPTPVIPLASWMMLLVFGALMPSFITAYADHRKLVTESEDLKAMGGLMERAERLGLLYIGMFLGLINSAWLFGFIALTVVLTNLTAIQRIACALSKKA